MNSGHLAALTFGLVAAVAWGAADYTAARASRNTSPESAALRVSILGAILYFVFFVFNHGDHAWSLPGIALAMAAGVSLELGILMLYLGLESGPVSIVSPVSSAYPIVTTVIFLFLFKGSLKPIEMAGIVVTVIGIALAAGATRVKKTDFRLSRGVKYALATVFLWGGAYAFLGQAVQSIGWQKTSLVDIASGLTALLITLFISSPKVFADIRDRNLFREKYVLLTALLQLGGGVIFSIGLSRAPSSAVITAISATYPALTMLLAFKKLNEALYLWSFSGAILTICGIILLSI